MAGEKQCSLCEQTLPIEAFPCGYKTLSGLGPYCKTCNSAKRRLWRMKNRSRANQQHYDYIQKNKSLRKRWTKAYRDRNTEQLARRNREWRKRRPHLHRASEAKRRAIKREATVGDKKLISKIYAMASSQKQIKCFYCGDVTDIARRHVDHKMPLSRGGAHSPENLVISCDKCNLTKHTKTAEEFLAGGAL